MTRHPCPYAQSILAGTAEVEDGCIRDVTPGGDGKEKVLPVVEALDEVCDVFFSALHKRAETTQALTSPYCQPALRRECLVALPGICATHRTLPSRCLLPGHLIIDYESTICMGGAEVRRGTLDGLIVTVKSIPFNVTGSSDGSQEVTANV